MASARPAKPHLPWIVGLSALQRLGISTATGLACWLLLSALPLSQWLSPRMQGLAAWDLTVLCYLFLAWTVVALTDETLTRMRAQRYDPSGYMIFVLIVSAASVSFVAIGFLVGEIRGLSLWPRALSLTLAMAALFLAWLLIHTLFAFHYAHLYYAQPQPDGPHHGGLRFPDDDEPDYLDFAYYSFVVGMTSQVSDVQVLSRPMRRLTLVHGVLSFIYNIAVLAMSINIISGVL
jgi:uncharacterized membrane protein